jgi:hypothetical protein
MLITDAAKETITTGAVGLFRVRVTTTITYKIDYIIDISTAYCTQTQYPRCGATQIKNTAR